MHDVVAILVQDRVRGNTGFMTWGRLFHPVDTSELEQATRSAARGFGFENIESVYVCGSLGEAIGYEYFFEGLLWFAHQPIPFGPGFAAWRDKKAKAVLDGDDVYGLGMKLW